MSKKKTRPPVADRLRASMAEVHESLTGGRPLTMRTVTVREPTAYDATKVRKLRDETGLSQAAFAKLLGVSPVLVQHWEQSVVTPRPIACRLMDEITIDPAAFLSRHVSPS